jgi:hypothetical protein
MATEERPIDDKPVCKMCRSALHRLCEKGQCTCDCEVGY